ncbi:hypothetical protein Tco_1418285 [Tanacetum coccineum]
MYTFSPMMVANSRKHHCRVRSYTREVLVISTNLDIQKNHYPLDFRNRRGDEARIKNTWYNQVSSSPPSQIISGSLRIGVCMYPGESVVVGETAQEVDAPLLENSYTTGAYTPGIQARLILLHRQGDRWVSGNGAISAMMLGPVRAAST